MEYFVKSPIESYIIGFLWADGYLRNNVIGVTISTKDFENIYQIFSLIGNWKVSHRQKYLKKTNKYYSSSDIHITDKSFTKFLYNNDFKDKSYISQLKILSSIPEEYHNHFFRGYIDGDGSFTFSNNNKRCNFSITSTLRQDWTVIKDLFNSINIEHYKIYNYERHSGCSSLINISNKWDIIKLGDYIYNNSLNIRLERKYIKFKSIKNSNIEKSRPKWTDDNIQFLKDNYKEYGVNFCAERLNRSCISIYTKCHRIGITK